MILTSPVIQDIEVEHGTIGISLSQNGDNILMSEDQLKQFISAEITALREAGEKMAQILKWELNEGNLKDSETLVALAEWEAANK